MGIPYQCVSPLGKGTLFCAAKGCSIQTFDLSTDPQLLFTWSHPSLKQADKGGLPETKAQEGSAGKAEQAEGQQPPSKRRKVGENSDDTGGENRQVANDAPANGEDKSQGKKKQAKGQPQKQEPPFVILLTATEDGSHVVAVTGQDKTLWVFEHDGSGSLKEVSQRAMPKRPCSLALTADGKTILSADKFGDVYALPLVPSADDESPRAASASSTPAPVTQQPPRGANEFTVHSQRNRRALEDQLRQREANAKRDLPKEGPSFAHQILLGHVSMLTAVLSVKDVQGRPYIITADRDEHIRVSRGVPQTHVIESFCLGHGAFVIALCTPPARPEILVSGGGDEALYVWDWLAGKLLGTADLLTHVRAVRPDAAKIAVAKLFAYELDGECHVAAICERIPALFIFQLRSDNSLTHLATLHLRGNPLDLATVGASGQTLLVAIDPAKSNSNDSNDNNANNDSLLILGPEGTTWGEAGTVQGSTGDGEGALLSREDLDKALYTVENLRKTEFDDVEGSAAGEAGSAGAGESAAPEMTPEQQPESSDMKMDVE